MKRPLTVAGAIVFVCLYFLWAYPVLSPLLCAAGGAAAFAGFLLRRRARWRAVFTAAVWVLIACVLFTGARYYVYRPAAELVGQTVQLAAHTQDHPTRNLSGRYSYTFVTSTVNGDPLRLKVMLYSYEELDLEPFDTVELSAELDLAGSNAESQAYYRSKRIFLQADSFEILGVSPHAGVSPPSYYIFRFREALSAQVHANLSGENGGLLCGILLGDKSGVTDDVNHDFRSTGLSHLMAVSGLHMSVWAMAVFRLLSRARIGRRSAAVLSSCFVLFFMALTGFTPSVVRSGVMMLLYLFSFLFRRTPDSLNSLGGAVLLFLTVSPFSALDTGLILSALATFGIIVLNPWFSDRLKEIDRIEFAPARRLIRTAAETVTVSVSACLFTAPVVLYRFGMVTLLAPVSNLMIAAWAAPAMITGGVGALFAMCGLPIFAQPLFAVSGLLVRLMIRLANAFADIPYVSWYFELPIAAGLVIAAILAAAVLWITLRDRRGLPICLMAAAVACTVAVSYGCQADWERDRAVFHVVEGSNPCVLIENAGQSVLIGSGTGGGGVDLLEEQNLYRVDFLYLWADDADADCARVTARCGVTPVQQGEPFRAVFDGGMVIESDGKTLLVTVHGRTIRIAENLRTDPADLLIAGGLAREIDYTGRLAVETNTRYAKGKNALTVPSNSAIIVGISQDTQIQVKRGE